MHGASRDAGPVIQHEGWSPASGTGSRREPEDTQALPSGSVQSESGDTALSSGSPQSGGRNTQEVPWLRGRDRLMARSKLRQNLNGGNKKCNM